MLEIAFLGRWLPLLRDSLELGVSVAEDRPWRSWSVSLLHALGEG